LRRESSLFVSIAQARIQSWFVLRVRLISLATRLEGPKFLPSRGLHTVLFAHRDMFLMIGGRFVVHDNSRDHQCLGDNPVAHPTVNHAANQISRVKFVWETELNLAGFIKRL
jgi:hypothetical protein